MKKSKKLVILFAIILVVALCVSLLAACSGKKKIKQDVVTGYLSDGIAKLMPENGYYFGIDTAINLSYTEGGNTKNYTLAVKGTIDTQPGTSTTDTQFMLELKEGAKTLVGLYYKDAPDGGIAVGDYTKYAPKLYLNINDEYKFAYNTYSIKKLVNDLAPKTATGDVSNVADESIDILGLLIGVLSDPQAVYTQKTVKKEIHVSFELNLKHIMSLLGDMVLSQSSIIDTITENLGMGDLSAEKIVNLDLDIPINVLLRFEKDKKVPGKLLGAKLDINTQKERPIKIDVLGKTIIDTAIPNVQLGIELTSLSLTSDQKVEISTPSSDGSYKIINLVNIDFGGKVRITDTSTKQMTEYDLIIKANANPIPVAYMGDTSWDVKEAVFKNLGMLHLSIVNVNKDPKLTKALIDLAYDPAHLSGNNADTAYLSVGLPGYPSIDTKMNVSALEGLIKGIVAMLDGKTDEYGNALPEKKADTSLMADGLPEMDILKEIQKSLTGLLTGGIAEIVDAIGGAIKGEEWVNPFNDDLNGTMLKVSEIVNKVINDGNLKLGVNANSNVYIEASLIKIIDEVMGVEGLLPANVKDIINSVKGIIGKLLGGDKINIEFTGMSYGTVPNDYDAFVYYQANNRGETTYVRDIIGPQNPQQALKLKEGVTAEEFTAMFNSETNITMKITAGIKTVSGAEKTFKTVYVQGFDPTKKGKQEVVIALKDINEKLGAISTIIGIVASGSGIDINKYPLSMVKYRVTITVI